MDQITATGATTTLIHFTHQVNGEWRIACMPGMTEFHQTPYHPNYQRTDDARGVRCPACERSPVFKAAQAAIKRIDNGQK